MRNPYKRIKELKEQLIPLEQREKYFMKYGTSSKKEEKEYAELKSDIFYISMELLPIEATIKYFEKKLKSEDKQ